MLIENLILYGFALFLILMGLFPILITIKAMVKNTRLEFPFKIIFALPYVFLDWVFNWVILSIIFFPDFPESMFELATARARRYRKIKTGRRKKFADFVCTWLNKFDPGHC